MESVLADHGLDSIDSIEIAMQIEEDLGYTISAETLPVLQKVKHFVNYIEHVEAHKKETGQKPLPWVVPYIKFNIIYAVSSESTSQQTKIY